MLLPDVVTALLNKPGQIFAVASFNEVKTHMKLKKGSFRFILLILTHPYILYNFLICNLRLCDLPQVINNIDGLGEVMFCLFLKTKNSLQ